MQIELFSLCDAATADIGKLNMLGVFDTIFVSKIPLVYPHCAVAVRIRFQRDEKGEHDVNVNVVDFDGKRLLPAMSSTINVNFPEDHRSSSLNLIFNIQMLKFETPGEHSIDLSVDYEWAEGFVPRFGLIEVNYTTQQRTVRGSARKFEEIIRSRTIHFQKN